MSLKQHLGCYIPIQFCQTVWSKSVNREYFSTKYAVIYLCCSACVIMQISPLETYYIDYEREYKWYNALTTLNIQKTVVEVRGEFIMIMFLHISNLPRNTPDKQNITKSAGNIFCFYYKRRCSLPPYLFCLLVFFCHFEFNLWTAWKKELSPPE